MQLYVTAATALMVLGNIAAVSAAAEAPAKPKLVLQITVD